MSALLIAVFLPTVVVGVVVGPLLDRLSRRRLMIASDLLRAARLRRAAVRRTGRVWIVALAGVAGIGNAIYRPTVNAALPNLLEEDELERGNALFQTVENMAWAVGPIIGGAIVAVSGTNAAYWINAVSFVFSALVIRLIPARRLQSEAPISKGHWHDIADGLAFARRSPALQVMLVAWSVEMLAVACVNVGEVVIAKDSFNAGDFGFGLLFGASGVGLAIGSFFGGMLAERRAVAGLYGPAMILAGIGYLLAAVAPERLGRDAAGRRRRDRQRRRGAVQRPADPARRAGLVPRPRLHARDERDVRDPRPGDGRRRPGDERPRRPLDLGDRRRLLRARGLRRDRALAAPPLRSSRGRRGARAGARPPR